jgi:laminin gamma 1
LTFDLRVTSEQSQASTMDVVLEGGDGTKVSAPIFAQSNQLPRTINQQYKFLLNEHPNYQWSPKLTSLEFVRLLANLTAIKIRATYDTDGEW